MPATMPYPTLMEKLGVFSLELYDILPIPLSIQTKERIVVYENQAMINLVGSYLHDYCYKRWEYLEDYTNEICDDCPANITLKTQRNHRIVRKTKNKNGKTVFFEITHVPFQPHKNRNESNYFLEIILDVTKVYTKEKGPLNFKQLRKQFWLGITSFGATGGEIITVEPLPFLHAQSIQSFYMEMSIYLFTAIGQGHDYNVGFYGPLPVLNYNDYIVFPYTFRIQDPDLKDERFQKQDYGILMIFTKIEYDRILFYRRELQEFLDETFTQIESKQDLTANFLSTIKKNTLELLEKLIQSKPPP